MAERVPGAERCPGRPPALPDRGSLRLPEALVLARARAEAIVAAAEQEARALREQAAAERERARQEGLDAGREEALAQAAELIAAARADAARRAVAAEPELVRLAVRVAGRLLGRELQQTPEAIAELAAALIREARGQQPLELVLNPEDARILEQERPRLARLVAELPELRIEVEPAIARGGCLVRGPDLAIDGRLETRLARVERALLGEDPGED